MSSTYRAVFVSDVRCWPIASFRCGAAIQSLSDRSGHRADLWVHGLGFASAPQVSQLQHLLRVSGENMRKITITIDDETYRKVRVKAAEQDTSVSALVKHFLTELAAGESDTERLKREERALRKRITSFRATDRVSREDTHRRRP